MTDERVPEMTDEMKDTAAAPATADVAVAAVATDGSNVLIVAEFADPAAASETYQALVDAEISGALAVSGVLVVEADANGKIQVQKVTDHSTKTGLKWGIVGGVVLGVIFPPSILASAATLGAAGAAAGKIRQLHHRIELGKELDGAIEPGHSGILALVSDPGAVEIRKALAAADHIVESAVNDVEARDIKAAAKEAQESEPAEATTAATATA